MEEHRTPQRPHEKLDIWRDAMELASMVYSISAAFPADERFGLVSQIRRAAVSIPSNIAEGAARRSTAEFLRFLSIARGSLAELDTQMQLAWRFGWAEANATYVDLINRLFARLTAFMNTLSKKPVEA